MAAGVRARPRQLAGGGWLQVVVRGGPAHGVVASRAKVVVAGYCVDHASTPHASREESVECWRKYLIEQTLRLKVADGQPFQRATAQPCKLCGTETTGTIIINGYPRGYWCDNCRTQENVTAWWNSSAAKSE